MNRDCPCKGCKERYLACHDSCKKYKEWTENEKKIKDKAKQERDWCRSYKNRNPYSKANRKKKVRI